MSDIKTWGENIEWRKDKYLSNAMWQQHLKIEMSAQISIGR